MLEMSDRISISEIDEFAWKKRGICVTFYDLLRANLELKEEQRFK